MATTVKTSVLSSSSSSFFSIFPVKMAHDHVSMLRFGFWCVSSCFVGFFPLVFIFFSYHLLLLFFVSPPPPPTIVSSFLFHLLPYSFTFSSSSPSALRKSEEGKKEQERKNESSGKRVFRLFLSPFLAISLVLVRMSLLFSLDVHVRLMSGGKTEATRNRIQHNTKELEGLSGDLKAFLQHAVSVLEDGRIQY